MATEKTWGQLEADIADTFRKWKKPVHTADGDYEIIWALVGTTNWRRRAMRSVEAIDERRVTLRFWVWDTQDRHAREIALHMQRYSRPVDNLRELALAVEWMRMADVRNVTDLIVRFYRQMYPAPQQQQQSQQQTPPREEPRITSSGAYGVLHIANDAPLEVAEAAYRALVKQLHPDVAGSASHAQMVALNAAIAQIRQRAQSSRR